MSNILLIIGEKIRKLRQQQGLSLEELAFAAQVNAAHLGQIERGLKNPTIETLVKVTAALEVPISLLFSDIPNDNNQPIPAKNVIHNKIDVHLSSMSLEEQRDVLQLIRIYQRYPKNYDND